MEKTFLIYNGAGANMFESSEDGQTVGHQGFAEFSVRLSDDTIRPDVFFWLGHAWGAEAYDSSLRKPSEFFLKRIDVEYSQTDGTKRGLGVVLIGDERFALQDCEFVGCHASLTHVYPNRYSSYYRVNCDYVEGKL